MIDKFLFKFCHDTLEICDGTEKFRLGHGKRSLHYACVGALDVYVMYIERFFFFD